MRKGAVPIPYIVAIVLGIAIIGLIGYWLFVSSSKLGETISASECQAKAYQYCSSIFKGSWDQRCTDIGIDPTPAGKCDEILKQGKPSAETGGGSGETPKSGVVPGLS